MSAGMLPENGADVASSLEKRPSEDNPRGPMGSWARRTGFKGMEKGSSNSGDIEINLTDGTHIAKPSEKAQPPPLPFVRDTTPPVVRDAARPVVRDTTPPVVKDTARPVLRETAPVVKETAAPVVMRDLEMGKVGVQGNVMPKEGHEMPKPAAAAVRGVGAPGPFYPAKAAARTTAESENVSRNSSGEVPQRAAVRPGPFYPPPKGRSAESDMSRNSSGQLRIEPLRMYKDQDDAMSGSHDEEDHMMGKESHMKYELRESPGLGLVTRIASSFEYGQVITLEVEKSKVVDIDEKGCVRTSNLFISTLEVEKWKVVAIDGKGCVRTSNLFISTYPLYNDILEYPVHFRKPHALVEKSKGKP